MYSSTEANVSEKENLVIQKIRKCCVMFDFTTDLSDQKWKKIKQNTLNELIEYFSFDNYDVQIKTTYYHEIFTMVRDEN